MLENNRARIDDNLFVHNRIHYVYTLIKVENRRVTIEEIKENLDWKYTIFNTITNKNMVFPIRKYVDVLSRFTNYGDDHDYYLKNFNGCYINDNGQLRITYFQVVGYEDGWWNNGQTYPALLLQHCIYKLS